MGPARPRVARRPVTLACGNPGTPSTTRSRRPSMRAGKCLARSSCRASRLRCTPRLACTRRARASTASRLRDLGTGTATRWPARAAAITPSRWCAPVTLSRAPVCNDIVAAVPACARARRTHGRGCGAAQVTDKIVAATACDKSCRVALVSHASTPWVGRLCRERPLFLCAPCFVFTACDGRRR